jgi:hypothetical protein
MDTLKNLVMSLEHQCEDKQLLMMFCGVDALEKFEVISANINPEQN